MTVWGGETPGVQISALNVALTIGPIFVVNAVVIALFHWRYRASYKRRLAARASSFPGPMALPRRPGQRRLATTEAKSSD